ncbi:MAG: TonB-dependent receptor plug domain-containing protein, partial [Gemmatimonadetes bacterium]|nr:TonB-dependent receptor plug domain-containing protein [Gemmatimonadota bacterium]
MDKTRRHSSVGTFKLGQFRPTPATLKCGLCVHSHPQQDRALNTRLLPPQPAVLLAALLSTVPFPVSPAQGQTESRDTVTLPTVVVTVLRSPVRLDRMPFATSVLAGPEVREGNSGVFIEEALHGLPGVRVQNRYNPSQGERISIRGFGARSQFGVRGIKILVDGIPATLPDGQSTLDHLDIGSLGRVEALRGPAAAMYGNGAGGVLLFESAAPHTGTYRQDATVVAGSNGLLRLQATGSGTSGGVAFRASATQSRFDGFRDNATGSGEDPYSQATRTTLNAGLTTSAAGGTLALQLSGVDLDALNGGSLPAELFDEGSNEAWGFNVRRGTRKDARQGQVGVSWRGG